MCMVLRNLNADLKIGTRLIVDRVSARNLRVVESPVCEGRGFVYGDESACALQPPHHVQVADQAQRTVRRAPAVPSAPAYTMTCKKSQGKTIEKVLRRSKRTCRLRRLRMAGCMFLWAACKSGGTSNCLSRSRNMGKPL